jgi:hypothetical protein
VVKKKRGGNRDGLKIRGVGNGKRETGNGEEEESRTRKTKKAKGKFKQQEPPANMRESTPWRRRAFLSRFSLFD